MHFSRVRDGVVLGLQNHSLQESNIQAQQTLPGTLRPPLQICNLTWSDVKRSGWNLLIPQQKGACLQIYLVSKAKVQKLSCFAAKALQPSAKSSWNVWPMTTIREDTVGSQVRNISQRKSWRNINAFGIQLEVFENSQPQFSEVPFGAVVIDLYDVPHFSELVHERSSQACLRISLTKQFATEHLCFFVEVSDIVSA